jgi:hypothetical protein
MIKRFCDSCGKEMDGETPIILSTGKFIIQVAVRTQDDSSPDLCQDCIVSALFSGSSVLKKAAQSSGVLKVAENDTL